MAPKSTISAIELHDSRIESIVISPGGKLEIRLSHICAYVKDVGGEVFTWSYSGILELAGVSAFSVSETMLASDYVTEGKLVDSAGNEIDLALLVDSDGGSGTMELLLAGSGAQVNSIFAMSSMVDLKPLKKLEQWKD